MYSHFDVLSRDLIVKLINSSGLVQKYTYFFMNSLASESIGRRYLLASEQSQGQLVTVLVHKIQKEQDDNII